MNLGPYEPNNIYCGECAEMMSKMPDGCIDLTVTSPVYDGLRSYNGYTFDFFAIARHLIRVTKPGGIIVWVVNDQTIDGSESGTSFKQALYFMAKGMRLHDTMLYQRQAAFPDSNRYHQNFEYMFVFSKGTPKTVNLIKDRPNKHAGKKKTSTDRQKDGTLKRFKKEYAYADYGLRNNIWEYKNGYCGKDIKHEHPAVFPDGLARDHILSWSNKGDLVLDPMIGSGTTAKMAMQNGRNYLGFDISQEYVELAKKRVAYANPPLLVIG